MLGKDYGEFEKFLSENRNARKFEQSVELAINFKEIDFSKAANRLNLGVSLPNGTGRGGRLAIFASDRNYLEAASKNGIEVLDGNSLASIADDKERLKQLLDYSLLAQPSLMPGIAKALGSFLGPRNKMPKPVMNVQDMARAGGELGSKITIRSKGRMLPTVHCVVGTEKMDAGKLYDNIKEVVEQVAKTVGVGRIRSVYVKLTMSKPLRLV